MNGLVFRVLVMIGLLGATAVLAAATHYLIYWLVQVWIAVLRRIDEVTPKPRGFEVKLTGQIPVTAKKENDHG